MMTATYAAAGGEMEVPWNSIGAGHSLSTSSAYSRKFAVR